MIHSLKLSNFQSHKNTELEFHPGVNVIIGDSRSGKTAILRALNWNRYNKPSGLALNSYWNRDKKNIKEPFQSIVKFENCEIIRGRSGSFNGYVFDSGKTLEAIGQDVPEEVEKIWNMSEVNIQKQFDTPFLISESAAEVARFFNKTIKLDKIDKVLASAESKRRKLNSEIAEKSESALGLEKDIESLAWIDKAEILIESASRREKRIEEKKSNHHTLVSMMEDIYGTKEKIKAFPKNTDEILVKISEAEKLNQLIESKKIKAEDFDELLSQADLMRAIIENSPDGLNLVFTKMNEAMVLDQMIEQKIDKETALKSLLESARSSKKSVDELPGTDLLIKLESKLETAKKIEDKIFAAEDRYGKIEALITSIKVVEDQVKTFERALVVFMNQLPSLCPLCGSELKEDLCQK